jgi:hypothetical protein
MEVAMVAPARSASAAGMAAAIVAALVATRVAQTQDTNLPRLLSLEETRQCICAQAQIEQLQAEMANDPVQQEFDRLDKIVQSGRSNIDTSDQAEVDSFRRLYNRREELRLQLQTQRGPHIAELNGLVANYNAQCANARMLKANVDAVQADPTACMTQ